MVGSLCISGNHLLRILLAKEQRRFANAGLGVYALNMDDYLSLTSFLPCFHNGECVINHRLDKSKQTPGWLLYHRTGNTSERKISISDQGILTAEPRGITLGERNEVKLATAMRAFVEHPNERGEVKLDEYNVAIGEKVRTLLTGIPRQDHMVASVLSNGKEVFCIISGFAGSQDHVIQSFLL